MMQNPNKILEILSKNTIRDNNSWKHKDLYRQLFNTEIFALAYQNIYANKGSMTPGVDGKTADGTSIQRFEKIIESLRNEKYQPTPVLRKYIPKKHSDAKRPLGIPSFDDRLVQEAVRLLLESIYEPIFSKHSHGFRPKRSCHSAVVDIKTNSNGMVWWIEGDIKGFFDNIDHEKMISILRKKISDERFLRLIRKFLNAGYLEEWKYNKTFSGTPQGGIVSPILANIYLNEFDQWVEEQRESFNKGEGRKRNPVAKQLNSIRGNLQAMIQRREKWLKDPNIKDETKQIYLRDIESYKVKIVEHDKMVRGLKLPSLDPMDTSFKRLCYTRYADDWVIGIIGSKEDAINLKNKAQTYFNEELKLELSSEKTLITHGKDGFKFLGFFIKKNDGTHIKKNSKGVKVRTMSSKYQILMPQRKEFEFINDNGYGYFVNGTWKPSAIKKLFANDDLEIIEYYNTSFRGLYNYYSICDNVSNLQTARWIWQLSWGKTMANKYRSTKGKMFSKYQINGKIGVKYTTKKGEKIAWLFNEPLRKRKIPYEDPSVDSKNGKAYQILFTRTSLMDRLKACKCELCGKENVPLQMHHIKRIKELRKRTSLSEAEKFMVSRNRKQIALCGDCHINVHKHERLQKLGNKKGK